MHIRLYFSKNGILLHNRHHLSSSLVTLVQYVREPPSPEGGSNASKTEGGDRYEVAIIYR